MSAQPARTIALLEVLDRDEHVRHYLPITEWPVRAGRALDNDLVLDDAHVAPHHLTIARDGDGVFIQVGDSVNGVRAGGRRLAAGERMAVGSEPLRLYLGDSHLRLRLAEHALAPERPLHTPRNVWHAAWPQLVAGVLVFVAMVFGTWLDADPDEFRRALGGVMMSALTGALVWCAAWSLVSKIFTRRSRFWWHVRVLLIGALAIDVAGAVARLAAFSLSWPAASDFEFVPLYAIGAAMLYFHALAVEPRRPERLGVVALAMFVGATAITLWFNQQNRDQWGDELYMSHLFPPALRVTGTRYSGAFVQGLARLKPTLDEKAKKRDAGGESADGDEQ